MKKEVATIVMAVGLACNSVTPTVAVPDIIVTPPAVESLEKKLMGVKILSNGDLYVVGLAYDTDNNSIPDTFESYLAYIHDDGWVHIHELIETTYNTDAEDDL